MFEINATQLPRFMSCNGSRLLGGQKPPSNDDTTAREEGIAAHWIINQSYRSGKPAHDFIGREAPNKIIITPAIANTVSTFSNYVNSCNGLVHGVEVDCSFEIANVAQINARCDHCFLNEDTLEVNDFKSGFRIVEPKENWTLIAYAIGLSHALPYTIRNIVLRVHQPRVPHPDGTIREFRLSYEELVNRYNYLSLKLAQPDDELHTGSHCDKCPSQTICPAFRVATFNSIDVSMTAHAESITDDMIAKELAIIQDAEKRIKSRRKQLEDLAVYRIRQGAIIENYSMMQNYGNREWVKGLEPDFLTMMLGVDCTRKEAITPAQAIAAGASETVVNQLSSRKDAGLKLTKISANKRAEKLFGKGK